MVDQNSGGNRNRSSRALWLARGVSDRRATGPDRRARARGGIRNRASHDARHAREGAPGPDSRIGPAGRDPNRGDRVSGEPAVLRGRHGDDLLMPDSDSPERLRWLGPSDRSEGDCRAGSSSNHRRRGRRPARRVAVQSLLDSRVRGMVVEDALEFSERLIGKMAIEALPPSTLILAKGFRNLGTADETARVISVVGATAGLVLLAPLLAAIAIAIKIDSRGPMFFSRTAPARTDGRSASGNSGRCIRQEPTFRMGAGQRRSHHARRAAACAGSGSTSCRSSSTSCAAR